MLLDILENYQIPFDGDKILRIKNSIMIYKKSFFLSKYSFNDTVYQNDSKYDFKKYELFEKIIQTRKNSAILIQRNFRKFILKNRLKMYFLISNIILKREKSVLLIQKNFRNYSIQKHFKSLLSNDAIFLYDFPIDLLNSICILSNSKEQFYKNINNNNIELSIQLYKPNILLKFHYSKYLNCYYVPLKRIKIFKKRLIVNIIINGEKIIDPRFSIINDSKRNFFNVINSFMIFKKLKQRSPIIKSNFKEPKIWEELFQLKHHRKLSYDTLSLSSKTDISKEMEKNQGDYTYIYNRNNKKKNIHQKTILPSILKSKRKNSKLINDKIKKVSFKDEIELLD